MFGVEADINYLGFDSEQTRDRTDWLNDSIFGDDETYESATSTTSFQADWFGTLRGRLGFAADNLLIYGTGGLAYGHMEASARFHVVDEEDETGTWEGSADDTNWGWTAGAGIEYGIDNWSLGLEYLYVDLGSADWNSDVTIDADEVGYEDIRARGDVDYQFSVVRATAKLRF